MRNSEEIMDLIIKLCKERDITMTVLSEDTGISKSTMSRYFNKSREFPINKVDLFSEALGVTTEFLLGIPEENKNERKITFDKKVGKLVVEIGLSPTEEELLGIIKQFNAKGKKEAARRLKEMLYIPDYTE